MKQNESIIRETTADEFEIEAEYQNLIWNTFISKLDKITRNRSLFRQWLQRKEMLDLMGCVDTASVKLDKQIEIKMSDEMYAQYKQKQNQQIYPYQTELQKQQKKLLKKNQKLLKKKNPSLRTTQTKDQLNTDCRIAHLNLIIQRCAVFFLGPEEKLIKFARPYVLEMECNSHVSQLAKTTECFSASHQTINILKNSLDWLQIYPDCHWLFISLVFAQKQNQVASSCRS
ncbi:MAG: hypothetical protein EZS28_004459 [Streblomastix strix]|uniref:Uncharacterized protein n=1 Tax=Streblomastix strix TaxID=222440 RepID=A0A5J4X088_9EUKA|nr:MAG: hypothetical protein EZS28_004459 [Streblomastix strix]